MDDETYDELALAMLYAESWRDKNTEEGYRFSWKGFSFESLDRLAEKGLINNNHRNKSVTITPEGTARALEVLKRLENLPRE